MAVHLGGKLRRMTKLAKNLGYVKEVEQVWEHYCVPPTDNAAWNHAPILSNGDNAEVGTQWACSCGKEWEVYVPDPHFPGRRAWRC